MCIQSLMVIPGSDVHFKYKPSKVVGKEGNTFFNVSSVLKNKCAVVYIDHVEYIE